MAEMRVTDLGEEKRCSRCLEWWPNDEEFYAPPSPSRQGIESRRCRACIAEIKATEHALLVSRRSVA